MVYIFMAPYTRQHAITSTLSKSFVAHNITKLFPNIKAAQKRLRAFGASSPDMALLVKPPANTYTHAHMHISNNIVVSQHAVDIYVVIIHSSERICNPSDLIKKKKRRKHNTKNFEKTTTKHNVASCTMMSTAAFLQKKNSFVVATLYQRIFVTAGKM